VTSPAPSTVDSNPKFRTPFFYGHSLLPSTQEPSPLVRQANERYPITWSTRTWRQPSRVSCRRTCGPASWCSRLHGSCPGLRTENLDDKETSCAPITVLERPRIEGQFGTTIGTVSIVQRHPLVSVTFHCNGNLLLSQIFFIGCTCLLWSIR
jgi:hypothetical protein